MTERHTHLPMASTSRSSVARSTTEEISFTQTSQPLRSAWIPAPPLKAVLMYLMVSPYASRRQDIKLTLTIVGENCYMKSTIGELINAEPVWTGEFFVPPPPPVVSTTTSAVSSPTPTPAGPLTCENGASNGIEFTTPAQNVYEIACGTDYAVSCHSRSARHKAKTNHT